MTTDVTVGTEVYQMTVLPSAPQALHRVQSAKNKTQTKLL